MKKQSTIAMAHRFVLMETFLYLIPIWLIFALVYYIFFRNDPQQAYLPLAGSIVHVTLTCVIQIIRIRKGAVGRRIEKWETQRTKRVARRKETIHAAKAELKELYALEKILTTDTVCVFEVFFKQNISEYVTPVVTINNRKVTSQKIGVRSVHCFAKDAILADEKNLRFSCGGSTWDIKNPYYLTPEEPSIVWQCEGHGYEKMICINEISFPYRTTGTIYSFDMFINGKKYNTFFGKYDEASKSVVVDIASVKKHDCVGKECMLRPSWDKRRKILLPKPEILTTNGVVQ